MNKAHLSETVILLRDVRSSMRNDVDARVIQALDKAIELLEIEAVSEKAAENRKAALQMIGEAMKFFPAIKALLEELFR